MNFATQSSVSDWPLVLKPRSRRSIQLSCLRIRLMLIGCINGWCSCLWDTEKERKGLGSQGGNRGFMYLRFGPRKGYLALRLYPWGLYKRVQPEPQINSGNNSGTVYGWKDSGKTQGADITLQSWGRLEVLGSCTDLTLAGRQRLCLRFAGLQGALCHCLQTPLSSKSQAVIHFLPAFETIFSLCPHMRTPT